VSVEGEALVAAIKQSGVKAADGIKVLTAIKDAGFVFAVESDRPLLYDDPASVERLAPFRPAHRVDGVIVECGA
jgi:hypothetical protein